MYSVRMPQGKCFINCSLYCIFHSWHVIQYAYFFCFDVVHPRYMLICFSGMHPICEYFLLHWHTSKMLLYRYEQQRDMLYNQTFNLDQVAFASEGIKDAQQTVCSEEFSILVFFFFFLYLWLCHWRFLMAYSCFLWIINCFFLNKRMNCKYYLSWKCITSMPIQSNMELYSIMF